MFSKRLSDIIIKLIMVGVSLFVAVLFIEGWARVTGRFSGDKGAASVYEKLDFNRHPLLGWIGKPGKSYTVRDRDITMQVNNNSLGFRDREFKEQKQPGVTRIAVLGDSFVWGYGMQRVEDRFTERLQEVLRKMGAGVEVYNFGIPGFGNEQEFLAYREIASGFDPDLVILVYYINDAVDNLRTRGNSVDGNSADSPEGGHLAESEALSMAMVFKDYLRRNLFTYNALKENLKLWDYFYLKMIHYGLMDDTMGGRSEEDLVALAKKILQKSRDKAEADGAEFMVLWTPYFTEPVQGRTDLLWRHLISIKNKLSKEYGSQGLDLAPLFLEAYKEGKKNYYQKSSGNHWSAEGNMFVATKVSEYLRREGLPPFAAAGKVTEGRTRQ